MCVLHHMVFLSSSELAVVHSLIMVVARSLYSEDGESQKIHLCIDHFLSLVNHCNYKC